MAVFVRRGLIFLLFLVVSAAFFCAVSASAAPVSASAAPVSVQEISSKQALPKQNTPRQNTSKQATPKQNTPKQKNQEQRDGMAGEIRITLTYEKSSFVYVDRRITPPDHLVAEELYLRKINGGYREKRAVMNRCLSAGGTFKNAVLYTMPRLEGVVNSAISSVNLDAKDSEIIFNPDRRPMFSIVREKNGRRVNEEQLYTSIYSAVVGSPDATVKIRPNIVAPKITAADNVKLTSLRAKYCTSYDHSAENRKSNIRLALKKINGTVLKSGAEFSFNKTVGRRIEPNGFKESNIILQGRYEKGIGGGVCQASTTVYNAALLSGLKITSARNHSLECSYELPSFDAMVSANSDLKFANDGKTPVFIRAYGTHNSAVVEIYGEELPYTIRRKSEVVCRKDAPETEYIIDSEYKYHEKGTQSGNEKLVNNAHGELKSAGYLLYYDLNGFFIKSEKIRTDTYQAMKGLIAVAP